MGVAAALHDGGGGSEDTARGANCLLRASYVPRIVLSPLTLCLICPTPQPYKVGSTFLILDRRILRLREVKPLVKCYTTK